MASMDEGWDPAPLPRGSPMPVSDVPAPSATAPVWPPHLTLLSRRCTLHRGRRGAEQVGGVEACRSSRCLLQAGVRRVSVCTYVPGTREWVAPTSGGQLGLGNDRLLAASPLDSLGAPPERPAGSSPGSHSTACTTAKRELPTPPACMQPARALRGERRVCARCSPGV